MKSLKKDPNLRYQSATAMLIDLKRALKEDGYIVHVTANNQHLIEIKELIYDEIKVKSDKYIRLDFNQV